jgi:hypothetical protein
VSSAVIGFSFFVWALLFAIDSVSASIADTACFNTLMSMDLIREAQQDLLFLTFTVPVPNGDWFGCAGNALTWNQWLFTGWANWIRFIAFGAVTVAFLGPVALNLFMSVLSKFRP